MLAFKDTIVAYFIPLEAGNEPRKSHKSELAL